MKNHTKITVRMFFTKGFLVLSFGTIIWFIFGTFMIIRESIPKDKLKVITGELISWNIINIPAPKRNIDILTFDIKNHREKIALYLNSIESYKPLTNKLIEGKKIEILYNDKGCTAEEGYNLHVYEIKFENQILLDYNKKTRKGKIVGLVLYGIGFLFSIPLISNVIKVLKINK